MASRRLRTSSLTTTLLSRTRTLSRSSSCKVSRVSLGWEISSIFRLTNDCQRLSPPPLVRFLSSTSNGGDGGGDGGGRGRGRDGDGADNERSDNTKNLDNNKGEDPFGLNYNDGPSEHGNVGTDLPPSYVRDPTTGKFTGRIEQELTAEERELLSMNQVQKEKALVDRFIASWQDETEEEEEGKRRKKLSQVAKRIRDEQMSFNVLGRSTASVTRKSIDENTGEEEYEDPDHFTKSLSPNEYKTFREYLKREHGGGGGVGTTMKKQPTGTAKGDDRDIDDDDDIANLIPIQRAGGETAGTMGRNKNDFADNPDLDLTWLTPAAKREMDELAVDPYATLMPGDLNPARKVNRKRAKLIPRKLLHHNNLSLLRRYVTPGGQIMNRVQSRLGAKDQRKIAKLVKRARHLGLIPHMGQWKFEDHGNIHEKDIDEDREWEKELVQRGLLTETMRVVRKKKGEDTESADDGVE